MREADNKPGPIVSWIALAAIIVIIVILDKQNKRIEKIEQRIGFTNAASGK